jgi:hypothetical protein
MSKNLAGVASVAAVADGECTEPTRDGDDDERPFQAAKTK